MIRAIFGILAITASAAPGIAAACTPSEAKEAANSYLQQAYGQIHWIYAASAGPNRPLDFDFALTWKEHPEVGYVGSLTVDPETCEIRSGGYRTARRLN